MLALGYAYLMQGRKLDEVQAARVEDAKKVLTTVLELVDERNEALEGLTRTIADLKSIVERGSSRRGGV